MKIYDPFEISQNMALSGAFDEAIDLLQETSDRTKMYVMNAEAVSWGQIKAAARRMSECAQLIAQYQEQALQQKAAQHDYAMAAE